MTALLPNGIPQEYGWILLEAAVICLVLILHTFPVGRARYKYFNKKFFADNFPELKSPPVGGVPDTGFGRFSDKLTYDDWVAFNSAQRAHLNFVEGAVPAVVCLLVSGLFYTRFTAIAGFAYIVGRILFAVGFIVKGPSGRAAGFRILTLSLLSMIISAIVGSYHAAGGCDALHKFLFP